MLRAVRCLALCVLLLLVQAGSAAFQSQTPSTGLTIDEAGSRIEIVKNDLRLTLMVVNTSKERQAGELHVEFLHPDNHVVRAAKTTFTAAAGAKAVRIEERGFLNAINDPSETRNLRLRYRVTSGKGPGAQGTISFPALLLPQQFLLKFTADESLLPTTRLPLHVLALDPRTLRGVPGVAVTAKLTISLGQRETGTRQVDGRTGPDGAVTLNFDLPRFTLRTLDFEVHGRLGSEIRSVASRLSVSNPAGNDRESALHIMTDKPLYQPGQALRIRTLAFSDEGKALAGKPVSIEIRDPDYSEVFRRTMTSSRFGEAHTEWTLPSGADLGLYTIEASIADASGVTEAEGRVEVRVDRYHLPTFTVRTKPDRGFYEPKQNAAVAIEAAYLFGQPLSKGHVTVVRKEYANRFSPDASASPAVAEGDTDTEGHFTARIDLWTDPLALASSYEDRQYTAAVTEPSSGRTAFRDFTLRMTWESIHVYSKTIQPAATGLPVEFIIVTAYADGSPAECDVSISEFPEKELSERTLLARISTNRMGFARLNATDWTPHGAFEGTDWTAFRLPSSGRFEPDSPLSLHQRVQPVRFLNLDIEASDSDGRKGVWRDRIYYEPAVLQIYSDKTIYAAGDPLHVRLRSTEKSGPVIASLRSAGSLVESRVVQLADGSATADFQPTHALQGQSQITALYVGDGSAALSGSRTVSFPSAEPLSIDLTSDRGFYAPGAEATLRFRIRSEDSGAKGNANKGAEALLGIRVVDKAVDERVRQGDESDKNRSIPSRNQTADQAGDQAGDQSGDLEERVTAALSRVDRTKPIPADLVMATEYLLNVADGPSGKSPAISIESGNPFSSWSNALYYALRDRYQRDMTHPTDDWSARAIFPESGYSGNAFDDPWGTPVRFYFYLDGGWEWMTAWTIGPDKKTDTSDDFNLFSFRWPYFEERVAILNQAVSRAREQPGMFVRDLPTLRNALKQVGEDLDTWTDPQGNPFRFVFGLSGNTYTIRVYGSGHDGHFDDAGKKDSDDSLLYEQVQDYTLHLRYDLQQAVNRYFRATATFPQTREELEEAMRAGNAPQASLVDPWGHPFYTKPISQNSTNLLFGRGWSENSYGESQWLAEMPARAEVQSPMLTVRSAGADGIEGNGDDFNVAVLVKALAERAAKDVPAVPPANTQASGTGSIHSVVTWDRYAPVPDVLITLLGSNRSRTSSKSDSRGNYKFENIPSGLYDAVTGEETSWPVFIRDIPVQNGITTLNITNPESEKTIQGLPLYGTEPLTLITTLPGYRAAPLAFAQDGKRLEPDENGWLKNGTSKQEPLRVPAQMKAGSQAYTPRVRDSFAETAYWQPALVTNRNGEATVRFKLPDNLTAWSVDAIASTVDGKVALGSTQFLAYQPFFLELDPPRVLTEGDEIAIPAIVRSYLDRDQTVKIAMKPENWFRLSKPAERTAAIKSGEAHTETFRFKAIAPVEHGLQRVTAVGGTASDAIEKPITVRPSGQETVRTTTQILRGQSTTFDLQSVPLEEPWIATVRSELRIYPNVMSQLSAAVEGILQRPAGCAEQTISSAYPSLLLLRLTKQGDPQAAKRKDNAKDYLIAGYNRLLDYQSRTGGFSYWVGGEPDIAVTAYALQFFHDADPFIKVDRLPVFLAKDWLLKQQRPDGSWPPNQARDMSSATDSGDAARRALALTGYVTRVLTAIGEQNEIGLRYLEELAAESNDAYALATLALAADKAGRRELVARTTSRLESLARSAGERTYWEAGTPTPFYGWGLPGNIETTAFVLRALAADTTTAEDKNRGKAIDQGLAFLLQSRDRYGVWHSTQATVLVLDTLIALLGQSTESRSAGRIEILVNGAVASSVDLEPQGGDVTTIDIGNLFRRYGLTTRIEVRAKRGTPAATLQLIETRYTPWPEVMPDTANGLRFNVRFDKTDLVLGDTVVCTVDAERVESKGNGMLLAEIGLPPGAEVDRESLEAMLRNADSGLSRYEIQPDRVVAYFWPRTIAGTMHLEFKFRPRFGLDAQTPASALYDYYNDESRVVAKPAHFIVSSAPMP